MNDEKGFLKGKS